MKKYVIILIALLTVVSCSKDDKVIDNTRKNIDMTGHYNELSVANADLAFDLFATLNETVGENETPLLLSPVSLSFVLGMLNNGAANETREAYMSMLGGYYADIDEINEFYRTLVSELPKLDKTAKLSIANSQWSASEFELLSSYTGTVSKFFNADINTLNYSTAVSDINNWCDRKTNGLISDFYSDGEISEATGSIMLDALYFKGVWEDKFDKDYTYEDIFTNYDGSESTVSYMSRTITTTGAKTGTNYRAITIPFGNEAFSMQILLPDEGVALSECVNSLTTDEWLDWRYYKEYKVLLPKFSVEYKGYLEDAIAQLGLESALNGGDYSNMSSSYFDAIRIKQATKFSIDEEGAEGAAVTAGEMIESSSPEPQEPDTFHVTRPFLYIVKENSSNTILFIGRVTRL